MDEYIILSDGTIVENTHVLLTTESDMIVYCKGIDIDGVYAIFSDSENISSITGMQYGNKTVYSGFTKLYAIREETDDLTTASLRKN